MKEMTDRPPRAEIIPRLLLPHEKLFEAPPAPRDVAQTTVANIVAELEARRRP